MLRFDMSSFLMFSDVCTLRNPPGRCAADLYFIQNACGLSEWMISSTSNRIFSTSDSKADWNDTEGNFWPWPRITGSKKGQCTERVWPVHSGFDSAVVSRSFPISTAGLRFGAGENQRRMGKVRRLDASTFYMWKPEGGGGKNLDNHL